MTTTTDDRNNTLALSVSCPTCKAGVGVSCIRRVYRDGWPYHLTRFDKAVRIDKAVRKEERERRRQDDPTDFASLRARLERHT